MSFWKKIISSSSNADKKHREQEELNERVKRSVEDSLISEGWLGQSSQGKGDTLADENLNLVRSASYEVDLDNLGRRGEPGFHLGRSLSKEPWAEEEDPVATTSCFQLTTSRQDEVIYDSKTSPRRAFGKSRSFELSESKGLSSDSRLGREFSAFEEYSASTIERADKPVYGRGYYERTIKIGVSPTIESKELVASVKGLGRRAKSLKPPAKSSQASGALIDREEIESPGRANPLTAPASRAAMASDFEERPLGESSGRAHKDLNLQPLKTQAALEPKPEVEGTGLISKTAAPKLSSNSQQQLEVQAEDSSSQGLKLNRGAPKGDEEPSGAPKGAPQPRSHQLKSDVSEQAKTSGEPEVVQSPPLASQETSKGKVLNHPKEMREVSSSGNNLKDSNSARLHESSLSSAVGSAGASPAALDSSAEAGQPSSAAARARGKGGHPEGEEPTELRAHGEQRRQEVGGEQVSHPQAVGPEIESQSAHSEVFHPTADTTAARAELKPAAHEEGDYVNAEGADTKGTPPSKEGPAEVALAKDSSAPGGDARFGTPAHEAQSDNIPPTSSNSLETEEGDGPLRGVNPQNVSQLEVPKATRAVTHSKETQGKAHLSEATLGANKTEPRPEESRRARTLGASHHQDQAQPPSWRGILSRAIREEPTPEEATPPGSSRASAGEASQVKIRQSPGDVELDSTQKPGPLLKSLEASAPDQVSEEDGYSSQSKALEVPPLGNSLSVQNYTHQVLEQNGDVRGFKIIAVDAPAADKTIFMHPEALLGPHQLDSPDSASGEGEAVTFQPRALPTTSKISSGSFSSPLVSGLKEDKLPNGGRAKLAQPHSTQQRPLSGPQEELNSFGQFSQAGTRAHSRRTSAIEDSALRDGLATKTTNPAADPQAAGAPVRKHEGPSSEARGARVEESSGAQISNTLTSQGMVASSDSVIPPQQPAIPGRGDVTSNEGVAIPPKEKKIKGRLAWKALRLLLNILKLKWLFNLKTVAAMLLFAAGFLCYVLWDLPDYSVLSNYQADTVSRIYSSDNVVLQELGLHNRSITSVNDIPTMVKDAFITAEDKTFYTNSGFDFKGIARALLNNVMRIFKPNLSLMGASTITQQVVKNLLLTQDRTLVRKVKEAILTIKINHNLTKDRILELYLNEIYLGRGSYGITTAALNYFNKPLAALSLPEVAFLAILPRSPNGYNPVTNYDGAKERRDWLLNLMAEEGKITPEEAQKSIETPIVLAPLKKFEAAFNYSQYADEEVLRQMSSIASTDVIYRKGLIIKTAINQRLQKYAYTALRRGIEKVDKLQGYRGPLGNAYSILNLHGITLPTGEDLTAEVSITNLSTNLGESNNSEVKQPEGATNSQSEAAQEKGSIPYWVEALKIFDEEHTQIKDANLNTWNTAVVLQVNDKTLKVGLRDGSQAELSLEANGWAFPNQKSYNLEDPVKTLEGFSKILRVGDVVYVAEQKKAGNTVWQLKQIPTVNGALVAMNPINGYVMAMQGGFSFGLSKFNRATQAYRQPGSAFKAFVYLSALKKGMTPASLVLDAPYTSSNDLTVWRPKNSSNRYAGYVTMRNALEFSRNLASIRIAKYAGLSNISHLARALGIYDDNLVNFSQVIGSKETTLLRMVRAYSIVANGGKDVEPVLIKEVVDRNGKVMFKASKTECLECQNLAWNHQMPPTLNDDRQQLVDPKDAYLLTHLLEGVVTNGIGWRARVKGYDIGGKTGTTNDSKDLWFFGITPQLVVGIFIGKDQPEPLRKAMASTAVIPIFQEFASRALPLMGAKIPFRVPPGITMSWIDLKTGKYTTENAKGAFLESFRTDNLPKAKPDETSMLPDDPANPKDPLSEDEQNEKSPANDNSTGGDNDYGLY